MYLLKYFWWDPGKFQPGAFNHNPRGCKELSPVMPVGTWRLSGWLLEGNSSRSVLKEVIGFLNPAVIIHTSSKWKVWEFWDGVVLVFSHTDKC